MRNPFRKLKRFKPQLPDRQTVRVSTKSWHGRLYNFWKQHAKYKTGSYKENLCHYVRVILIWAPLAAFLYAHPKRWPIVRPATVLLAGSMFTGGGYAVYNYPSDVGKVLLFIAAVTAVVALIIGAAYTINEYHREIGRWVGKSRGGRFLKWIGRGLDNGSDAVFDFFAKDISRNIGMERGWLLLIVPGLTVLTLFLLADAIKTLAIIGAGIGVITVFGLTVALVVTLVEVIKRWRKNHVSTRAPKVKHGDGLGTVLGQYVVARKGQICPFIEIES